MQASPIYAELLGKKEERKQRTILTTWNEEEPSLIARIATTPRRAGIDIKIIKRPAVTRHSVYFNAALIYYTAKQMGRAWLKAIFPRNYRFPGSVLSLSLSLRTAHEFFRFSERSFVYRGERAAAQSSRWCRAFCKHDLWMLLSPLSLSLSLRGNERDEFWMRGSPARV